VHNFPLIKLFTIRYFVFLKSVSGAQLIIRLLDQLKKVRKPDIFALSLLRIPTQRASVLGKRSGNGTLGWIFGAFFITCSHSENIQILPESDTGVSKKKIHLRILLKFSEKNLIFSIIYTYKYPQQKIVSEW